MTAKKTVLLWILCVFFSSTVVVNSLYRAIDKDFWLDEVSEIEGILSQSYVQLLNRGVGTIQYSASPFYFFFQKAFMAKALRDEKNRGEGFDWRVSLRVVPAVALALGCIGAFWIMLPISWVWALSIPLLVANTNFALYYGAETRNYSTWFAISLMFASSFLALFRKPTWQPIALFVVLSFLLVFNIITAVAQVAAACFLLCVLEHKDPSWRRRVGAAFIGGACALGVFFFYRHLSVEHFLVSIDWSLLPGKFLDVGLLPLEGVNRLMKYLVAAATLLGVGYFFKLPDGKNFNRTAWFILGQLGVLVLIFTLQNMTGQYFAQRHGVFITASQVFMRAAMIALLCQGAVQICRHVRPQFRHGGWLVITLFVVLHLNYISWTLTKQPQFIKSIFDQHKPYCFGPVWVAMPQEPEKQAGPEMRVLRFNVTNKFRHENKCGEAGRTEGPGEFVDYSPNWIFN